MMAVFLNAHLQKWETSARFTIDCSRPISVWARWCVDSYVNLYGEHDGSVLNAHLQRWKRQLHLPSIAAALLQFELGDVSIPILAVRTQHECLKC